MISKNELRKQFIAKRNSLEKAFVSQAGELIFESLKSTKILDFSKILVYCSFKNEVATQSIIEYLLTNGRDVYLPVCDTLTRTFDCVKHTGKFRKNSYGIMEPENGCSLKPQEKIGCAIIPGVVFDTTGNRIGFGAGYYDKFLSENPQVYKIGICYDFQLCERIPSEKHDHKMNMLITEKRKIVTE